MEQNKNSNKEQNNRIYFDEPDWMTASKNKTIKELKELNEDLGIDINKWIQEYENLTYHDFMDKYYFSFGPTISSWKGMRTKLSYKEYIKKYKEDEELFDQKYQKLKETEKKIGEMWENGEINNFILKNPKHKDDFEFFDTISSELNSVEDMLNHEGLFEENEINNLKTRLKNFRFKLKEKIKPKPISISLSNIAHNKIKNHCTYFNLNIDNWIEKTLLEKIDDSSIKLVKLSTEEAKKELENKYKSLTNNQLVETEKLLLLPNFSFVGISNNNKPVYNFIGTEKELTNQIENNIKCSVKVIGTEGILTYKTYIPEFIDVDIDVWS